MEVTEDYLKQARTLRFPKKLEAEFIRQYNQKTSQMVKGFLPFIFLIASLFIVCDIIAFQQDRELIVLIRLLSLLSFPVTYFLNLLGKVSNHVSFLLGANILCTSASIDVMIAISDPADVGYTYYFSGMSVSLLCCYTVSRLRFYQSNILGGIVLLMYECVAIFAQDMLSTTEDLRTFFVINFILLGFCAMGAIISYSLELLSRREFIQQKLIEQERKKAEQLLLNILPEDVSLRLRKNPETIADSFENATVLFGDLVGFTELSRNMSPIRLVSHLNEIFSQFDDLTEKYKLEKIKTIGDAYMVSTNTCDDETAGERIGYMALEMLDVIHEFGEKFHYPLEIRIGINSGPLVAGVIGKKKFIYDLWGDTVNTAARMEAHGLPGEIQVTDSTYQLMKERFIFEERGMIEVKGKGMVSVYLLKDRKKPVECLS